MKIRRSNINKAPRDPKYSPGRAIITTALLLSLIASAITSNPIKVETSPEAEKIAEIYEETAEKAKKTIKDAPNSHESVRQAPPGEPGRIPKSEIDSCYTGQYWDNSAKQCLQCHRICKECFSFKLNCISCADGYYFDPIVKTHCIKSGLNFHAKFEHFEEIFFHLAPSNLHFLKHIGIGQLVTSSLLFGLLVLLMICGYCCCFGLCYARGININELEIDEFFTLVTGGDWEGKKRKRLAMYQRVYQQAQGSGMRVSQQRHAELGRNTN